MNVYELDINLIKSHSMENHPVHYHIECEESLLREYLNKICTMGILIDDGYDKRFIPGHRIDNIEVKVLERVQVIPDVTDSISSKIKKL